jgi:hypothetical protein
MEQANLVLRFKLAHEDHYQTKWVARVTVDGRGGLTYSDVQSGRTEKISLAQVRSFSLRSLAQSAPNLMRHAPLIRLGVKADTYSMLLPATAITVN